MLAGQCLLRSQVS